MTPKEKAIELLGNFDKINLIATRNTKGNLVSPYKSRYLENKCCVHNSKKGALFFVDEILKNIPEEVMSYKPFMMNTDYWQEVKEEINK